MWIKAAKITPLSQKFVILGLVFVLLAFILSCGYVQQNSHSAATEGIECNRTPSLANFVSTKDSGLFLSILFLSFVALALFIKGGLRPRLHANAISPSLIFLKATKSIPKIYNPILQALRRGIIQPQIYNLVIS